MDVASCAPQLFAQSMSAVGAMFECDDPLAAETGAKIVAAVGSHITVKQSTATGTKSRTKDMSSNAKDAELQGTALPETVIDKLKDMCMNGSPTGAKAAVKALVHVTSSLSSETEATESTAYQVLQPICKELLSSLWRPSTLKTHSRILAALKALSMACRLIPALLEELAEELYDCVMSFLVHQDLSMYEIVLNMDVIAAPL